MVARLWQQQQLSFALYLAATVVILSLHVSRAFVPPPPQQQHLLTTAPSSGRLALGRIRQQGGPAGSFAAAAAAAASSMRSYNSPRRPMVANAKPDVQDTSSIILEMKDWAHVITRETHVKRDFQYVVSSGTSLPEVLLDFWKAVSCVIEDHRATREDRSLRRLVMFVAPFCEELRDYETMEHAHQLLQQSARDGGCQHFGGTITHLHYHPNYRYQPKPEKTRMASRHSPHPAFSIDALYRTGGLRSLTSMREAPSNQETTRIAPLPPPPAEAVGKSPTSAAEAVKARGEKKKLWAAKTRASLESTYKMAAAYGSEDVTTKGSSIAPHLLDSGRGVPESSQEIMHTTQAWLRGALKDAAESDAVIAATTARGDKKKAAPRFIASLLSRSATMDGGVETNVYHSERSTLFSPPTAAETAVVAALAAKEARGPNAPLLPGSSLAVTSANGVESTWRSRLAAVLQTASAAKDEQHSAGQHVPVREDDHEAERPIPGVLVENLPGKDLVKRMKHISQYIVARSKTPEEYYSDVWEIITELVVRAAARGYNVPTEDYSSSSVPRYGALIVTPELATYNADAFFRFQETLNRGLRHLPMDHDISIRAFHPECVSDTSSNDHRFLRSPFPTLYVCYHGVRSRHTALVPRASTVRSSAKKKGKKNEG